MKAINLTVLIGILLTFTMCTETKVSIPDEGKVIVQNGKNTTDTIPYKCTNCDSLISDTTIFYKVVRAATKDTREKLNFPRSFIPVKLEMRVDVADSIVLVSTGKHLDSTLFISVNYSYVGSNAYGTELEGESTSSYYIRDNEILDIEGDIKLSELKLVDGIASRYLFVYNSENNFLRLLPSSNNGLIVSSSINCVDDGDKIILYLEGDNEIKKFSFNDFNCDSNSFFWAFTSEEIELLANHKLLSIGFSTDKEFFICPVPLNQADYFIQYSKLIK